MFLSFLESAESETTVLGLGLTVAIVIFLVVGLLFLFLGVWLIRKGIVNDSIFLVIIGVLLTGFWIGLIVYLVSKDSPTLLRKRKEKLRAQKRTIDSV